MKKNKKLVLFLISLMIITFISYVVSIKKLSSLVFFGDYIAGKYGEKCYIEGNEPKTIKHPIYFETLKDCQDYVNFK